MLRLITFLEEAAGVELVLPVTPAGYQWAHEAAIETVTVDQLGDLNFFGGKRMGSTTLHDCLLPAQAYPFLSPGAGTNPWLYLEQLERWVDKGTVVRWMVSGTPVNAAVLLEGVTYREQDGTNDLYADITLRQYTRAGDAGAAQAGAVRLRAGTAASRDSATGTATASTARWPAVTPCGASAAGTMGTAPWPGGLAAANGIANANLIRPGQVLTIPPLAQLPAAAARPPSAKIAAATKVREVKEEESGTARLVPWVPENTVKSLADLELDKIASGGGLWQSTRW